MTYRHLIALSALLTHTAHGALSAPMPAFKTASQLATWRAEMAAKPTNRSTSAEDPAFFTGKPYIDASGGYAFKYRSYNPELARWTSEDPSGFPDGANGNIYAPTPTYDLDFAGLLKWSTLTDTGKTGTVNGLTWALWTIQTNDGAYTINMQQYISGAPAGTDYTYNCNGYTFAESRFWINDGVDNILKGDGYKVLDEKADKSKARVAYWSSDIHTAKVTKTDKGVVTSVSGKIGATIGVSETSPAGQGFGVANIKYYE